MKNTPQYKIENPCYLNGSETAFTTQIWRYTERNLYNNFVILLGRLYEIHGE